MREALGTAALGGIITASRRQREGHNMGAMAPSEVVDRPSRRRSFWWPPVWCSASACSEGGCGVGERSPRTVGSAGLTLIPSGSLPTARYGQADGAGPNERKTHHVGMLRRSPNGTGTFLNDFWAYDLTTNTWTQLDPSGARPPARNTMCDYVRSGQSEAHRVRGHATAPLA